MSPELIRNMSPEQNHYERITYIARICFHSIGVPIPDGHDVQYLLFGLCNVLLAFPIVNGMITAVIALAAANRIVYSTCIYIMSVNLLVQVKLLICAAKWLELNAIFEWVRGCYEQRFADARVAAIWQEVGDSCTSKTVLYTR